jgi:hypothetical protein
LAQIHIEARINAFVFIAFVQLHPNSKVSPVGTLYQQKKSESVFYKVATFYSVDEVTSYLKKTGFIDLKFTQTIFHRLSEIEHLEPIKKGYGEGSFVVVKALKPNFF